MMQTIFSVIADQWRVVLGILLLIILCQVIIGSVLRIIFGNQLTPSEYLSLGMSGWILSASLLSLLCFFLGFESSAPFNLFLLIGLIIILIFYRLRLKPDSEPDSKSTAFFLLLFFLVSSLLRLAFVSKAILPAYFDSAQHYLLIKIILGDNTAGLLTSLTTSYYHLGYHFLTAFMVSTLQTEITRTMLILGQMVLAIIPISTFFLIKHKTRSNMAGIFAVSLSAFGWYMPAHAVDWGKYPALTSLGLLPFVVSLAYLLSQNKNTLSPQKQRALYLLLGVGILVSGFIHSRSLVIIGIAFIAWIIATWWQKLSQVQRVFLFSVILICIVLEIIAIQKQKILTLVFDPYINKGILITPLVLFLAVFAQRHYPQFTFTCILAVCFLLGSLFIPVLGLVPGYAKLTLLDRPFVEMILFLPLSLLGGLGLAGLGKDLQHTKIRFIPGYGLISLIACGFVLINAFATYDLYPSECCVIAGPDDIAAITWMDDHLSMDVRIAVSATELKVLASDSFEGYVGGDAGIWITPLINRVTIPLRYDLSFDEQSTLDELCQMRISHIYIGETGQTFYDSLHAQPAWYKILLSMPEVKVYQVLGCNS